MGMLVYVHSCNLFAKDDCTNGGVSARPDIRGLCITNCDGPFDPSDDYPSAQLVMKDFGGSMGRIVKVVPTEELDKGSWTMFGGNYAGSGDSRFGAKIDELLGHHFYGAVPIHDRVEG